MSPHPFSYLKYLANSTLMFALVALGGAGGSETFKPLAKISEESLWYQIHLAGYGDSNLTLLM